MEVIIIRGGTLIVIRRASKESAAVVRKAVRCHSEQERRRLSDYLLLHKVFIANRFYKRNSAGKNRVWVSPFIQKKGSEPFLRERSDTIKTSETPYLDERSGKV